MSTKKIENLTVKEKLFLIELVNLCEKYNADFATLITDEFQITIDDEAVFNGYGVDDIKKYLGIKS